MLVGVCFVVYALVSTSAFADAAFAVAYLGVVLGSYPLIKETWQELRARQYAVDYIALLALIVALVMGQYAVALVIAFMASTGRALEAYGVQMARRSLTSLIERIPRDILMAVEGNPGEKCIIADVRVGDTIFIRKGEVIPLDGLLESENGLTDESSVTGEPYIIDKIKGDVVRSGTVNKGEAIVVRVTAEEKDSTYHKIIELVEKAQGEKAPLIRLADKASGWFAAVTLVVAAVAYFISGDWGRVLAVLVIATPCPLILATPIALLGGVNAAAKRRIIVKRLASLESLARVNALVFDKTGTITLGVPRVTSVESHSSTRSVEELVGIASALERNSLHPLAKSVVLYAHGVHAPMMQAAQVEEQIGKGIGGEVGGAHFFVTKVRDHDSMAVGLYENDALAATFLIEDEIKPESRAIIERLHRQNFLLHIFTGDKASAAARVRDALGAHVLVTAEMSPEDKQKGVADLKQKGFRIAMVGDGINDAPALATADVGLVFSNEERTAASDAADIVFLGGEFSLVCDALGIAQRTVRIALTSIFIGMGLSGIGMIVAALGGLPPIAGAVVQELIDVVAILNALRASRQGGTLLVDNYRTIFSAEKDNKGQSISAKKLLKAIK